MQVCRTWNRIGTPILYSSYHFKMSDFSNTQKYISLCFENPKLFASRIRLLDAPQPYIAPYNELLLVRALLPLCNNLKRFRYSNVLPSKSFFTLLPRGIQDLSVHVSLQQLRILAEFSTEFRCLTTVELFLVDHHFTKDESSPITKIYLPITLTFKFTYEPSFRNGVHLPLTFSCPRLQNLAVEVGDGVTSDQLISDSSELTSIRINYRLLAAIEQKSPHTLLHSCLQQVYIYISGTDTLHEPSFLVTARNLRTFAIGALELEDIEHLDRLFTLLKDECNTPKLTSFYCRQGRIWSQTSSPVQQYLFDLQSALRRRGVDFFVPRGENPLVLIKIESQSQLLQLFNPFMLD